MNDARPLPAEYAAEFVAELASYSCPLINPPSQRQLFHNKIHNIQLAITRMQAGAVLMPGAEFSFWHYALAPTIENGYREGAMFINHQVTTSIGGGLCQLSGLIYNLALLSGCRILERYNHSIDAYGEDRYIPLGRDATVAYGRKNLRFANPHNFAIAFELNVDEQHAWGSVRGTQALDCEIEIATALRKTIPSPVRRRRDRGLAPGEEAIAPGLTGKVVDAWRVVHRPGQAPQRETLSRDRYAATRTLVRRGHTPWMKTLLARFGHG